MWVVSFTGNPPNMGTIGSFVFSYSVLQIAEPVAMVV